MRATMFRKRPTAAALPARCCPGAYTDPLPEGARRKLGECTFGIWNEDAYQLYMDVDTLQQLLTTLDERSLRAARIAEALEKFTLVVDFEQDLERQNRGLQEGKGGAAPCPGGGKRLHHARVLRGGQRAHRPGMAVAYAETHRKTERTFALSCACWKSTLPISLSRSQPAAYEMCRKYYPALFGADPGSH